MTALARKNGKLLRINGKLVRGDCYCDCDDPDCPNCCIKIDWGTFDSNGDLTSGSLVTLVMPTKNSRIVCDGDQVTVRIKYTLAPSPGTSENDHKPYVSWDRSWKYVSHTPDVDPECGLARPEGLIEWCNLAIDPTSPSGFYDTYEVVLKYDHCWADSGGQFGDIEAGDRDPGDFDLITGTFCNAINCCDPSVVCQPCCWYLDPNGGVGGYEVDETNSPVFWSENLNGDRIRVRVQGLGPGLLYCLGDTITLDIRLVPNQHDAANPWVPQVSSTGQGWTRIAHSPGEGNGTVDDGPPYEVNWGDDVTALDYSITIHVAECPDTPGLVTVGFQNSSDNAVGGTEITLEWLCCDGVGECTNCWECCCPPCDFGDGTGAIDSVDWVCDDGTYVIQFSQSVNDPLIADGCEFTIPGTWTQSTLDPPEQIASNQGSITAKFVNGTWVFDGGTQWGKEFHIECPGVCNGGQACEGDGCYISWTANGAECDPEGEV